MRRDFDDFQMHGRTSLNYQTNGARWDALQSLWAGDTNSGARITYDGLTGNDYKAGNGQDIASSYLSHNVNYAFGWDLTDKSSIEFKGQRIYQQNLEFPGLYFDVGSLNTESYALRYTLRDQGIFDKLVVDTWFNGTTGTGNTTGGAKQAFVQDLLGVSFNPTAFNQSAFANNGIFPLPTIAQAAAGATTPLNLFRDNSTSNFATTSIGYRLFSEWNADNGGKFTTGTDMRSPRPGVAGKHQLHADFGNQHQQRRAAAAGPDVHLPANAIDPQQHHRESRPVHPLGNADQRSVVVQHRRPRGLAAEFFQPARYHGEY